MINNFITCTCGLDGYAPPLPILYQWMRLLPILSASNANVMTRTHPMK